MKVSNFYLIHIIIFILFIYDQYFSNKKIKNMN